MDNSHGWYVCSSHHCKGIARGQGDASGKPITFRGILRLRTKCGINPAWIFPFPEKVMSPCFTQVMSKFFNILKCFVSSFSSFRNNKFKIFVTERVLECPVCASFPSYPISIFENGDFESLMIAPPLWCKNYSCTLAVETNKSITGNAEENVNSMSPQNSCKVHISGFVRFTSADLWSHTLSLMAFWSFLNVLRGGTQACHPKAALDTATAARKDILTRGKW